MKSKNLLGIAALLAAVFLSACGGGGDGGDQSGTPPAGSTPPISTPPVVEWSNAPPVANAGVSREVPTGVRVSLNGSASAGSNGEPLTYKWRLTSVPAGSTAVLQGAETEQPSFFPELDGQYVVSLIVNDGQVDSAPATVAVLASSGNIAPTANAGMSQYVQPQTSVTLDGSASADANGDPLTYRWSMTSKPEGSAASLSSSAAVHPTFVADKEGEYVVSLVVNDGTVDSEPAAVTVNVSTSSLTLYSIHDVFGVYEQLEALPYSGRPNYRQTIVCAPSECKQTFTVGKFRLVATGQNYTITNLVAEKLSASTIRPAFTGLANNQVIASGTSVVFELGGGCTYQSGGAALLTGMALFAIGLPSRKPGKRLS
ncbi:PKD domain-containing protein [Ottowia caeni]|uniref:PKD domain-containing protein n=1 Tax=Ottowia caeni TaxID=2870339 RepID=UPI003D73F880